MKNINLFDLWEKISVKDKIKIAIDGSSYQYYDKRFEILSTLGAFDQFEIIYVSNTRIKKKNSNIRIFTPRFIGENGIILKEQSSYGFFESGFGDKRLKNVLPIDLIGALAYGDIVISQVNIKEIIRKSKSNRDLKIKDAFIGSLNDCLSAIRGWVNNNKKFTKGDNYFSYQLSNWMSVTLSIHKLMPNFSYAWKASVYTNSNRFPLGEGTVHGYLSTIFQRCSHLLTTRDILEVLKVESFKDHDCKNDNTRYSINYYYGYFLLLVTAIIDTVEWIIYWYIRDKINNRGKLSIRKDKNCFESSIIHLKKKLREYIKSNAIQSILTMIYSLRNLTAHDKLPDLIGRRKNLMKYSKGLYGELISIKTSKDIENISDFLKLNKYTEEQMHDIGVDLEIGSDRKDREVLINPILFVRFLSIQLFKIIDNIFKYLCIEKKLKKLQSKEEKDDFYQEPDLKMGDDGLIVELRKALIAIESEII